MALRLAIDCLCGAVAQNVTTSSTSDSSVVPLALCHCTACRHSSGLLCTSYCPIEPPAAADHILASLSAYASSAAVTRYFCRTCGCHVFRRDRGADEVVQWQVATGVIVEEIGDAASSDRPATLAFVRHDHVADTQDGGLAVWLPSISGRPMAGLPADTTSPGPSSLVGPVDIFASCHCRNVCFTVRHPDRYPVESRRPHSGFSDLIHPFATTAPDVIANPSDDKWWLVQSQSQTASASPHTRYLAGTCACRSCRLSSGFEIQTWAFVPRANIFLHHQAPRSLDFSDPDIQRLGRLATYSSSPGVERNFCSRCGATVFWHDIWRPDLVDVSVGLFHQTDHASRAESILSWCTSRVSFAEEAVCGRRGRAAQRAESLVASLKTGTKSALD